jgi:hypothetical protein
MITAAGCGGSDSTAEDEDVTYKLSDLQGTWRSVGMAFSCGDTSYTETGYVTYDAEGNASTNLLSRYADGSPTYSVYLNAESYEPLMMSDEADYYTGLLASGKTLMPWYKSYDYRRMGGLDLKQGSNYAYSDLSGTWGVIMVSADYSWHAKGTMVITGGAFSANITDNNGTRTTPVGTFSIAGDGTMTLSGYSGFTGYLDAGKTVIGAVSTNDQFRADTDKLIFLTKTPSNLDENDFGGRWFSIHTIYDCSAEYTFFYGQSEHGFGSDLENCIINTDKNFQICVDDDLKTLEFRTK